MACYYGQLWIMFVLHLDPVVLLWSELIVFFDCFIQQAHRLGQQVINTKKVLNLWRRTRTTQVLSRGESKNIMLFLCDHWLLTYKHSLWVLLIRLNFRKGFRNVKDLDSHYWLLTHYERKAHSRRARTKNGDAHTTRLRHRISHYRVIRDARPDASPISIHGRRATSERVAYLISDWGPMPLSWDTC
jgi:hypothetical protein